jgi:hypothetical protein
VLREGRGDLAAARSSSGCPAAGPSVLAPVSASVWAHVSAHVSRPSISAALCARTPQVWSTMEVTNVVGDWQVRISRTSTARGGVCDHARLPVRRRAAGAEVASVLCCARWTADWLLCVSAVFTSSSRMPCSQSRISAVTVALLTATASVRWLNDTWVFDGSAWLPLVPTEPTSAPSARYGHTLNLASAPTTPDQKAEDQQHLLLLLFGGDAGGRWLSPHQYSALLYNDVWLLQLAFSRDASDRQATGRGQKILSMAWRQVQPVNAGRAGQAVMEGEEAEPVARQAHHAFVSNGCLVNLCFKPMPGESLF